MRALPIVGLFLLAGCSNIFTKLELVGQYLASYQGNQAMLILNADHTYKHTIKAKDGQVFEGQATWEMLPPDGGSRGPRIVFYKFHVITSYPDEKRNEVEWSTEVDRTWLGRARLCFDSDVGYCYVKQLGNKG